MVQRRETFQFAIYPLLINLLFCVAYSVSDSGLVVDRRIFSILFYHSILPLPLSLSCSVQFLLVVFFVPFTFLNVSSIGHYPPPLSDSLEATKHVVAGR